MSCFGIYWRPVVAGRVLQNRVCLSVLSSFCLSWHFLVIVSLVFSKFWYGARNQYEVLGGRAIFSKKTFFCLQNLKNRPKMDQKPFLKNLLKNLVINFYLICSISKIYVAVFLQKSHIWENFYSWVVGHNVLSQSDCKIF